MTIATVIALIKALSGGSSGGGGTGGGVTKYYVEYDSDSGDFLAYKDADHLETTELADMLAAYETGGVVFDFTSSSLVFSPVECSHSGFYCQLWNSGQSQFQCVVVKSTGDAPK